MEPKFEKHFLKKKKKTQKICKTTRFPKNKKSSWSVSLWSLDSCWLRREGYISSSCVRTCISRVPFLAAMLFLINSVSVSSVPKKIRGNERLLWLRVQAAWTHSPDVCRLWMWGRMSGSCAFKRFEELRVRLLAYLKSPFSFSSLK